MIVMQIRLSVEPRQRKTGITQIKKTQLEKLIDQKFRPENKKEHKTKLALTIILSGSLIKDSRE